MRQIKALALLTLYLCNYMNAPGGFTISLDFELYWGVRDTVPLTRYNENIKNVHALIPKLLNLFTKYQIHATWCVVGFVFFDNKESLINNLPCTTPLYNDEKYNPYNYININSLDPIYHFAPDSIKLIKKTKDQEIGTHTFSHYFCLEKGQTLSDFQADIDKALSLLNEWDINCKSIIFPRNQYNNEYLSVAKNAGIQYYRGNEKNWIYQHKDENSDTKWKRMLRLFDAYINISGHNTFEINKTDTSLPVNIPSSSFLRPYNPSLFFLENIRYRRIANSMTFAAVNKQGYHLWWHPHNFGKYTEQNLRFLERILKHYEKLNKKLGFTSKAMNEY